MSPRLVSNNNDQSGGRSIANYLSDAERAQRSKLLKRIQPEINCPCPNGCGQRISAYRVCEASVLGRSILG